MCENAPLAARVMNVEIKLNGRPHEVPSGTSVAVLLASLDLRPEVVAVEVNQELVARDRRAEAVLDEGDRVEQGENPYEVEIALIDDLRPGDIPVFACGGPTETITPWGELLTTAAIMRGAVGPAVFRRPRSPSPSRLRHRD